MIFAAGSATVPVLHRGVVSRSSSAVVLFTAPKTLGRSLKSILGHAPPVQRRLPAASSLDQERPVRNLDTARPRRRLLTRRTVGKPDAAFPRRGVMPGWNIGATCSWLRINIILAIGLLKHVRYDPGGEIDQKPGAIVGLGIAEPIFKPAAEFLAVAVFPKKTVGVRENSLPCGQRIATAVFVSLIVRARFISAPRRRERRNG